MKKIIARKALFALMICALLVFNFTACSNSDKKNISYPSTFTSSSSSVKLIDETSCTVTDVYNGALSMHYNTTISGSGTWSISGDKVIIELTTWKIKDKNGNVILEDSGILGPITLKATIKSNKKITYMGEEYKIR
ncbi:MAG TPA: hypothetical protein GX727_05505 [Clostridium sp.]|jgi:hypothetical protein|nr:hypothetical protein [Clostridium sp.]